MFIVGIILILISVGTLSTAAIMLTDSIEFILELGNYEVTLNAVTFSIIGTVVAFCAILSIASSFQSGKSNVPVYYNGAQSPAGKFVCYCTNCNAQFTTPQKFCGRCGGTTKNY